MNATTNAANGNLPPRHYLSREEAAGWLSISVDTFMKFDIPYCDFGPRCKRFDVVDIIEFANDNKSRDSARTSETNQTQRRRQICDSTDVTTHRNGGSRGRTRADSDIAEVLELTKKTSRGFSGQMGERGIPGGTLR